MSLQKCGRNPDRSRKEQIPHGTMGFPCAGYNDIYTKETGDFFPWHWHEEFEINYVKKGSIKLQIPNEEFVLDAGDLAVLNGNILHYAETSDFCDLQSLVFSPSLLAGSDASAFAHKYIQPLMSCASFRGICFPAEDPEAGGCFRRAFEALRTESFAFEFTVREQLSHIMLMIYKKMEDSIFQAQSVKNTDTVRVEQMLSYIHSHYADNITLSDIAGVSGIGERECLRCFKRTISESPMQYLLKYRLMQSAAILLERPGESISDIAGACGFDYPSYYARQFRRFYGCTPSEYRKGK